MVTLNSVRCARAILNEGLHSSDDLETLCRLGGVRGVVLRAIWKSDSILPTRITLTPLLLASLFIVNDQGVVSVDKLLGVLRELSLDDSLKVFDNVVLPTVGTT